MKYLRILIFSGGILTLALGLAFAFQNPLATSLWPWPDGRLSYLFIGSILAAASAAMFWIGWTGEWGALPAGTLNVLVIALTTAVYFFYLSANSRPGMLPYGIAGVLLTFASLAMFLWSRKIPLSDGRPTPLLVRISFGFYVFALLGAGLALVLRIPVFPWAVNPDSSVIFGCIFLGDACYFIYGLLKPLWYNALGQLLSFLAYDIVLIVPFLRHFEAVKPEFRLSLTLYTLVLIYSACLSIYFLFVHKPTRRWRAVPGPGQPGT